MIISPVIFLTIATGVAGMSSLKGVGNAVATVVVSRWEKAIDMDQFRATMNGKGHLMRTEPISAISGAPAGVQLGEANPN